MNKINEFLTKMYVKNQMFKDKIINDEQGAMGIKEIAGTIAVVVIVGLALAIVNTNLGGWIGDIWDRFIDEIDDMLAL